VSFRFAAPSALLLFDIFPNERLILITTGISSFVSQQAREGIFCIPFKYLPFLNIFVHLKVLR